MTDEQLIADARTGSREAFEALFDRYASVNLGPVPVPARLRHAIADGFEAALSSLLEAALFLLRAGPGLLLWAILLGVPGWLIVRRWRYGNNSSV